MEVTYFFVAEVNRQWPPFLLRNVYSYQNRASRRTGTQSELFRSFCANHSYSRIVNEETRPKVVVTSCTAALMQYFLFLQQANKRRRTSSAGDNDDNGDSDESGIVSILKCELISWCISVECLSAEPRASVFHIFLWQHFRLPINIRDCAANEWTLLSFSNVRCCNEMTGFG